MEELTPQQKRRLEKIVKIIEDGPLAVAEFLFEIEETFQEKVSELKDIVPNLDKVLESVRGQAGKDGEDGDIGPQGPQGEKGDDGKDGKNGKDGRDGRDGRDGSDGKDGEDGKDGKNGADGIDGKDGSPDTPEQVVYKVNQSKTKINSSQIAGFNELERIAKVNQLPITTTFVNGQRAKNLNFPNANVNIVGDTAIVTNYSTSNPLVPTGTVDSNNTEFVFSEEPAALVIDNATYRKTNSIGEVVWSWNDTTKTATTTLPPQSDIFGLK